MSLRQAQGGLGAKLFRPVGASVLTMISTPLKNLVKRVGGWFLAQVVHGKGEIVWAKVSLFGYANVYNRSIDSKLNIVGHG